MLRQPKTIAETALSSSALPAQVQSSLQTTAGTMAKMRFWRVLSIFLAYMMQTRSRKQQSVPYCSVCALALLRSGYDKESFRIPNRGLGFRANGVGICEEL